MSKNLTQLGYDISSFYNIPISESFEKLESGITGQTRAMRSIGVDISQARLQQELYNMGIKESVKNLSQADKSILRYKAIMEQTTNAQGDMARTIQTPANALRVLTAQLQIAGRAIGSIFIPALEAILPVVTAVVEVIGDLASEVASLFGFKMPTIDYSSLKNVATGADDAADAVSNIGNNAAKSAKQVNNLISGFDELNILQTDSNDSAATGAGAGTNGNILSGIDLPSYDALKNAVSGNISAIKEQLEQYMPLIKGILKTVLEIGAAFLAWKISNGLFSGLMNLFPSLKALKGNFAEISAGLAIVAGLLAFAYLHSENLRRGLGVLGKAFENIKKTADNLAKSFNVPAFTGEQWTTFAAGMTVFIGAVAIALGAPIFGTIAVVGGAAVLAIQAIGYAASDSIEPVNLFGDGISSATEKKIKPFIKEMDALDETMKGLKWSGQIITDKNVSDVKLQVKTIADTIIDGLDADKNQALKTLNPLKNMLDSKTYDSILAASSQYYSKQKTSVQQGENEINKIMQKASDQKRSLTNDEYKEISKIEENMKTTGIKNLSASETESNLIFQRLKDNHTSLSAQEASEIVKNSLKQRDTTISDAKKQYEGIMTEAQRMYDVGTINKDQYDQIRDAAGKSKDETIKSATEQHTKIVDEAKKQSGECVNQVDWQSGQVKSKWTVMCDTIKSTSTTKWGQIKTFFHGDVPKWWNTSVSPWFTAAKWQELFNNVKTAAANKWQEIKDWWNNTAIVKWWKEDVEPWFTAKKWEDMMDGVKTAFKNIFKDAANGAIGMLNGIIGAINIVIKGLDTIHITTPKWAPGGSKTFGVHIPTIGVIPKLATGNVAYAPTVAEFGEYPDASSNPEITAPQSVIRNTVEESNEGLAATFIAAAQQIVEAIEKKETTVEMDGEKVTKNVNKRNANRGYNLGLQST